MEEILDCPTTSFAYPYGGTSVYTVETVDLIREIGYECACSTSAQVVVANADRFQLPRVMVTNWDGEEFSKRLSRWFDG